MTNKQVTKILFDYLSKQDPKVVAELCANFFIDLNEFLCIGQLEEKDAKKLIERTKDTMKQIEHYLEHGFPPNLLLIHVDDHIKGVA